MQDTFAQPGLIVTQGAWMPDGRSLSIDLDCNLCLPNSPATQLA